MYPVNWAIYKWIDGEVYSDELISDEREPARDLANFVAELHSIKVPCDAPKAGRLPLRELNEKTIAAINEVAKKGIAHNNIPTNTNQPTTSLAKVFHSVKMYDQ